MKNSSGLIVEFIGMPGSGKSTLNNKVKETLEQNEFDVENPTADIASKNRLIRVMIKLIYFGLELLFHPLAALNYMRFIFFTKQKSFKDFSKVTLNLFYISYLMRKSENNNSITILDQGILQALWSVFLSSRLTFGELSKYELFEFIIPDLIIKVEVDHQILNNRLEKRSSNQSRLGQITSENRDFKASEKLFNLLNGLAEKNQVSIIKVKNNTEEQLLNSKCLIKNEIDQLLA
ncbi:AAA family ATPase [Natroniella sulfidigena]|uniref:AAA family ATPase n=1 Tax=Natroniella sulfidigena TaxID=723921 RepID=UPI00200A694A|nr:AAA family ATPase [Natroniella sulfidigena]MCK8816301.1 AAA family ATPase [Natroniella sulfidigena]